MSTPISPALEGLSADALAGDAGWWAIYDESFPDDEREPPEVILASVRGGTGLAFRARLEERTAALATTHLLIAPATVFLVYLGVARERRGCGIGGALLAKVWQESAARLEGWGLKPAGLVWEVDRPDKATSEERERRLRRIAFFERQGGVVLTRPYVQPPLRGGPPVPMTLMFRPAVGGSVPDPAAIDALVRSIYFEKYGGVNGLPTDLLERLARS